MNDGEGSVRVVCAVVVVATRRVRATSASFLRLAQRCIIRNKKDYLVEYELILILMLRIMSSS
jgi:hypothetical protein